MTNIILFATYWNEIEWIKPSLEQIDKISPCECIICDGCFDPSHVLHSTDGTREIIEEFIAKRAYVKLIPPVRFSRLKHYLTWFASLPLENTMTSLIPKLRSAISFNRFSLYRLNQCTTFNYMIKLSKLFRKGRWFMTYDCDQFYSDTMLDLFSKINEFDEYNVLTGRELTFFEDFNNYTDKYETRDHNNMPHRIYNSTRFIPTRHPVRIVQNRYKMYADFDKKYFSGNMYHYHLKSKERINAGYSLGDRKPPEKSRTETVKYTGKHPEIINRYFHPGVNKR